MLTSEMGKNIRSTIKEVLEQYVRVEDFLFTTFNFDPDFFEEHIIAYLMGMDRKISTIGDLNSANAWVANHHVSVYYDQGQLCAGNSPLTLPAYPQCVKGGVFHPKVIVIYGDLKKTGKKAAHLFVSSCNLTVSGYGRNREAFAFLRVNSASVARNLAEFIRTIQGEEQKHGALTDYLEGIRKGDDSVEFFWNYGEKTKEKTLAARLAGLDSAGTATVISPYYDEKGPEALIRECMSDTKNVTVMPALDGTHYNINRGAYHALAKQGVRFSAVPQDGNIPRFVHAKILAKGDTVIIGSYNFTTAAIKSHNAEAALIFKTEYPLEISGRPVQEDGFMPDDKAVNNQDDNKQAPSLTTVITVKVNWASQKVLIHAENGVPEPGYDVKIEGVKRPAGDDHFLAWQITGTDKKVHFNEEEAKALLRHKQFSVSQNGKRLMTGLIYEVEWQGIRPEIGCDSLDEAISEWYYDSGSGKKKNMDDHNLRSLYEDDKETEQILLPAGKKDADLFDNYYLLSQSLENMVNKIADYADGFAQRKRRTENFCNKRRNLYATFKTRPGSMVNILSFLEKSMEKNKQDANSLVYNWLICMYLQKAAEKLPNKINPGGWRPGDISCYEQEKKAFDTSLGAMIKACEKAMRKSGTKTRYMNWVKDELFRGFGDV